MTADLTHLGHRRGQTAAEAAAPDPRHQIMLAAVLRLGELAAADDVGGLRIFLHELEQDPKGTWRLDPWTILRNVLLRQAARPPRIHVGGTS